MFLTLFFALMLIMWAPIFIVSLIRLAMALFSKNIEKSLKYVEHVQLSTSLVLLLVNFLFFNFILLYATSVVVMLTLLIPKSKIRSWLDSRLNKA